MTTLYAYCDVCRSKVHVHIDDLRKDTLNDLPNGDITCAECHLVLNTLSADREGRITLLPLEDTESAQEPPQAATAT